VKGKRALYPSGQSIGRLISVTSRKLQPLLEQRVRDQGVSYGTFYFLRALWEEDRVSQGELSTRVRTSAPTTMAALDKLRRDGLVRIKDDPRDGRRLIVALTAKGRRLEDVLLPRLERLNRTLLRGLSRGEIEDLRRMLRLIQENASLVTRARARSS
jgi:DNA-binding MarR family transcriptional regulator